MKTSRTQPSKDPSRPKWDAHRVPPRIGEMYQLALDNGIVETKLDNKTCFVGECVIETSCRRKWTCVGMPPSGLMHGYIYFQLVDG